jgi:peptide deformylase
MIVIGPSRILNLPSNDIPKDYDVKALHSRLRENLLASNTEGYKGVGLSAVQIGEHLNAFIVKDDESDETRIYINPVVLSHSKKVFRSKEGCLSFPGLEKEVLRWFTFTLRYYDDNWEEHTETRYGLDSIVQQHEIMHLNGETIYDL